MSGARTESFTPMMTMMLLSTSEAECTASLIIAPELAKMPASSLKSESTALPAMLTRETRVAVFSKSMSADTKRSLP